jgi:hypothetical protein
MTGDRGNLSLSPSFGLAITGSDPTVELKNNIFYTTQTAIGGGPGALSFEIGTNSSTFANLDSNYNAFFSSGPQDAGFRTGGLIIGFTNYPDLAAATAVSDDANWSKSIRCSSNHCWIRIFNLASLVATRRLHSQK